MVFSSIPAAYLDPSTWHQQQQQHQQNQGGYHHGISTNNNVTINNNPNPLLPTPPLPPPQHPRAQSGPASLPTAGSIRPGSMAERARMANIAMPEMSLKCPRCESTNTKFCYFNNYSLSQPRHFCKTCRRYWTRGGALRNVPVGGGCRRNNKRSSKSTSSSKSAASERSSSSTAAAATSSASSGMSAPGSHHHASVAEMMGLMTPPPGLSNLRFMSQPLLHHHHHQHMTSSEFGEQLGLSGYELGSMGSGGAEQWRIPPPLLIDGGGASGASLYGNAFEGVEFSSLAIGGSGGPVRSKEAVKVEERGGGEMSLMRRFNMGISSINYNESNQGNVNVDQEENYNWGGASSTSTGNAWTDLSAINNNNNSSCSNASAL